MKTEEATSQKGVIKSYGDLKVYQLSYSLAMDIFKLTSHFPKEEVYSLTDQMRCASRSISANVVEGWAKRRYENIFKRHLVDSIGSCEETKLWLKFALDCHYISETDFKTLAEKYDELGKMLHGLLENRRTFH